MPCAPTRSTTWRSRVERWIVLGKVCPQLGQQSTDLAERFVRLEYALLPESLFQLLSESPRFGLWYTLLDEPLMVCADNLADVARSSLHLLGPVEVCWIIHTGKLVIRQRVGVPVSHLYGQFFKSQYPIIATDHLSERQIAFAEELCSRPPYD